MYIVTFSKYVNKKYVTLTHRSKRGGMATCIVIYLKTVFCKYLHICKTMYELLFNVWESHELTMFQISYLYLWWYVIKVFGHIMFSLYYWHSNVNKSFEIKIDSEQNLNSLNTIYFKGRASMIPYYAKVAFIKFIILLFTYMKNLACF